MLNLLRQSVSALKDKIASLYKSISPEQTVPAQTVYRTEQKLKKIWIKKKPFILEENREKIKDWIIKDIWNLYDTKEEKEKRKRGRD